MNLAATVERFGWRRVGLLAGAVVFAVLAVQSVVKADAEWAQVFVDASRKLLRGEDFLAPGTLYLYPPFGALVGLLFVPLPDWGVRLAFFAVDVAAVVALAIASWRIAGGGRLDEPSRETRDDWTIAGLGALVAVPFAWNTLLHQQVDLLIDAWVALGMLAALRRRPILAGVLIGLGAAFKGPPLLFLIWFVWRGEARAAIALVVTAIGVNLLPDLVARAPDGVWLGLWLKRWVLPATGADTALGSWGTAIIYNQSLAGTAQRLVNTTLAARDGGLDVVAAPLLATRPLKFATYGAMAAMALATLAASVLGDRRRPADDRAAADDARALELAMVAPMMLLFSPMSGLAHFPIVAPAALILARRAVERREAAAILPLAVAVLAALAVNKDLVGAYLYDRVLWSGAATLCALALWLGGLLALGRATPTRTRD